MKRPWDRVKFRVSFWDAPDPEPGDEMRTARGRRYLILELAPHRKSVVCLVLPDDEPVAGRVFEWRWNGGKRK
jgi:hypothetical protein